MDVDCNGAAADVGGPLVDCNVDAGAWMLELVEVVGSRCTARASAYLNVSNQSAILE